MARRQLSEEQKRAMQEARVQTRQEREEARDALQNNPQFMNSKFWMSVPAETFREIEKAMNKAGKAQKKARIAELEAELESLREDVSG